MYFMYLLLIYKYIIFHNKYKIDQYLVLYQYSYYINIGIFLTSLYLMLFIVML
jgi:hypothetical protein